MENNIQQARDVLTGIRNLSSFGSAEYEYRFEKVGADGTGILWRRPVDVEADPEPQLVAENVHETDARLLFMLGNPELLDAIDGMFATYLAAHSIGPTYRRDTERIANAILAVDTAQEGNDD